MEVARSAPSKQLFICLKPDGSEVFRTDLDGDYMAQFLERNKDKPFFLYFSPHAAVAGLGHGCQGRTVEGSEEANTKVKKNSQLHI
jgi:hypothetical protein